MPVVGYNNVPLHERAMYGFDGTLWRPCKIDASGNLVFTPLAGATIEVTQDTAADLKATVNLAADQNVQARGYSYVGGAWQKSPIPLGYSGVVRGVYQNTDSPGGDVTVSGGAVPSGSIWVIQAAAVQDYHSVPTFTALRVNSGGTAYAFTYYGLPPAKALNVFSGAMVLSAGEYLEGRFVGTTLHDLLTLTYLAMRVDINL